MGTRKQQPKLSMTASEIINGFCDNTLVEKTASKVFPNVYIGSLEADIIELTASGYAVEYEVKISRADFRNDAKKRSWKQAKSKYDILQAGERVNRFYYIVPEGLITESELPEFAGLIYVRKGEVRCCTSGTGGFYYKQKVFFESIRRAPALTKEKLSERIMKKCFESVYYRFHKYRNLQNNEVISENEEILDGIKQIDPVPLTEELLIRTKAFRKSYNNDGTTFHVMKSRWETKWLIEHWTNIESDSEYFGIFFIAGYGEVKYLNELQNYYFVFEKKELKIYDL
jgi:hypothetical protein